MRIPALRKIARSLTRPGHDSEVWPVALLLFAILLPALGLVWFMGAAMRNERLALRQKLNDVHQLQLADSQTKLHQHWQKMVEQLENLATNNLPSTCFAQCVQSGLVDSVIVLNKEGQCLYPNSPSAIADVSTRLDAPQAEQLEHDRKFSEAAEHFGALGHSTTNAHLAARAFQAQARCLLQAGQPSAAIHLVEDALAHERFNRAADAQGRLIVANAELMALELKTNRHSPDFRSLARRLAQRLTDYQNPVLAASQRLFLMKELLTLAPEVELFTLPAEELAAAAAENIDSQSPGSILRRSSVPGLWQFTTPKRQLLGLVRSDKLLAAASNAFSGPIFLTEAQISLVAPETMLPDTLLTLSAGEQFPGWHLALTHQDRRLFETAARRQTTTHLLTGLLVLAAMGVVTLLTFRVLRRQVALARLKNDLVATVSHELKTPLTSMRVLVETLLDSDRLEEEKTREYLQLIARENERLGRLIQNFLTFSRLDRKKYAFNFALMPIGPVIDRALYSARGRFDPAHCRVDLQIEAGLPMVWVDADALGAALINLLENAYKYSEDDKHIVVRARIEHGQMIVLVEDNGIGIPLRERKKIFQPFYQADQHLSRKGSGCGLGLSIVRFIVTAHHGSVRVESRRGGGSRFALSLPLPKGVAPDQSGPIDPGVDEQITQPL